MVALNETKIAVYGSLAIIFSTISIVVFTWITRHRRAIKTTQNPSTPENVTKRRSLNQLLLLLLLFQVCWHFTFSL